MNDHLLGQILSCQMLYEKPYQDEAQNILFKVAGYFGKHPSYLMVRDRKPKRIYMRQIAIFILLNTGMSQNDVAAIFHITQQAVDQHQKKVYGFIKVDSVFRMEIMKLSA